MKKARKLIALLMAVILMFAAMPLMASADNPEKTAIQLTSGIAQTTPYFGKYNDCQWYKTVISAKGTLKINITTYSSPINIYVIDSNGEYLKAYDYTETAGSVYGISNQICATLYSSAINKTVVDLCYKVNKGTYYIKVAAGWNYDYEDSENKVKIKATFPSSAGKAKITYLSATLSKGSTLQLGAVLSPANGGTVTWKSNNSKVASISLNGKVTAKAKGATYVSATCGDSKRWFKIIVI